MTRKEYLNRLNGVAIKRDLVGRIETVYCCNLPTEIQQMISFSPESVFFDDDYRVLSLPEVLAAQDDLHVDFKGAGMIPIIDCGDNDFIVYHICDKNWSKFNIVDETVFKRRPSLAELLI